MAALITTEVLIIGTGFSGLAAAILAQEAGFEVQLVEKGEDVGGVWRENTYPGAACDLSLIHISEPTRPY